MTDLEKAKCDYVDALMVAQKAKEDLERIGIKLKSLLDNN